jgi:cytochrome c556
MRKLQTIFAIGLCLTLPGFSLAEDEDPDVQAVHVRHALMEIMGWNMVPVANMSTGKQPYDQAQVSKRSKRLAAIGEMIGDAFARNTSGSNVKTEARDAIWQNPEDFAAKASALVEAARDYTAATADGEAAARKAFVKLSDACKSCHEKYRNE